MRKYQPQAIIRKTATVGMLAVAALFISKPLLAEGTLASDSSALSRFRAEAKAAFQKEYPMLASVLSGKGETKVIPAAADVRKEDAKPVAEGNANEINSLYDQLNRYADLGENERVELGKKVAASGDSDLIDTYNETKAKYKEPSVAPAPAESKPIAILPAPTAKKGATPAGKGKLAEKPPLEEKPIVAPVAPAGKVDINALYDQVNRYSELGEADRAELGKKVMASGDSDLIDVYNETKAKASPAPIVKPAQKDSLGYEVALPPRIEKRVETRTPPEKRDARKASLEKTEVELYKQGATNPEVLNAVAPVNLAALKDSLNRAVNACYDSINSMTPENYLETGIRAGKAIEGIEAIIKRSFPKDDPWARYTMGNLKEYYVEACAAMPGGKK